MTDTFFYKVQDSAGAASTAIVSITITGVADGLVINGQNGAGTLTGTSGDDIISGQNGIDVIYGLEGADQSWGGNGDDRLFGGHSIDRLYGENGSDRLDRGPGNDFLSGGRGSDTFVFAPGFGNDVITDFNAVAKTQDVIEFDRSVFATVSELLGASSQVGADVVIAAGADDSLTLKNVQLSAFHADDFRFV